MEFSKASALRAERGASAGETDPVEMRDRALARQMGLSSGLPRRGQDDDTGELAREGSGLRWMMILILDLTVLLAPIPLVIGVPPVLACREIQSTIGFYAGDSFKGCAERGIRERWNDMESRLKKIVRGSGY